MADKLEIPGKTFWTHLKAIHTEWKRKRGQDAWDGADALAISLPKSEDEIDTAMMKTSALHYYLTGFEFFSTVMVLTDTEFHVLAGQNKIKLFEPLKEAAEAAEVPIRLVLHTTSKEDANAANFGLLTSAIKKSLSGNRVGVLQKDLEVNPGSDNNIAKLWVDHLDKAGLKPVDMSVGVSSLLVVKKDDELDSTKKAAVMTNKVLKHAFVKAEMEAVFNGDKEEMTLMAIANNLNDCMEDPSKIGIKLPEGTVEPCFFPIVQSGGTYNIKPSAQTGEGKLTEDVVICCVGARYKHYSANIARTYCIDPVPKVEETYQAAFKLFDHVLGAMQPGEPLTVVPDRAKKWIAKKHPSLAKHLPKSLGFSLGLDFKDSAYPLSSKANPNYKFAAGMVFNLAVGFSDVPLEPKDVAKAKGAVKDLDKFSVLIADTVVIAKSGAAEVLTKATKEWGEVSYFIKEDDGGDDSESEDEDAMDEDGKDEGISVKTAAGRATILKSRLRERSSVADEQMERRQKRAEEQQKLHMKKIKNGLAGKGTGFGAEENTVVADAKDFNTFKSSERYPPDVKTISIFVDMEHEAVFLPVNGQPVPFHISTIKSVSMPEPDKAAYLRINFFTPGQAVGKDAPKQMAALVEKHKQAMDYAFVKEFTYRSLDKSSLEHTFRLIQELRKRSRQRENQAAEEADLVVQAKLVKMKDQRIPRLADLTMRPPLAGRKTIGNLDSHTNGLRFSTHKTNDVVDIMYANIKHAFFQPCQGEIMVVIHFHLKDPIMVGKKKTQDIQFLTEVMEASQALDTRSSMYDPDELEGEQREREMRKALNAKFKEFTNKVKGVASRHGFSFEFDIPYRELAFNGTPNREMVTLQPSVRCLVNLTDMPFFVMDMSEVEHCHFERCTMASKNFDVVFVLKNLDLPPRMVAAIDMKDLDAIQDWLTDIGITCTVGTVNFNWKQMMELVKGQMEEGVFWKDEEPDGTSKPEGWYMLDAGGDSSGDEEEDEESDEYGAEDAEQDESDEESEEESDDESDFEEEEDESEYDEEEEEEADGQSWEELEKEAQAADRARQHWEEQEDDRPSKKSKGRGASSRPSKKARR